MAEYFEEVETNRILVDTLLEVGTYGSMQKGDLIIVNGSSQSVRFASSATNNYILTTDTATSTNLAWKSPSSAFAAGISGLTTGDIIYYNGTDFVPRHGTNGYVLVYSNASSAPVYQSTSQLLGFNASGQIIYSSGASGTNATALNIGTSGQILTVMSGHPAWTSPGSLDNVVFSLDQGQINGRSSGTLSFSHFTWDNTTYGTSGINLTNGKLSFYCAVTSGTATLNFNRIAGSSTPTSLIPTTTLNSGSSAIQTISVTSPSGADGLYALQLISTDNTGTKLYGFQLKFNR